MSIRLILTATIKVSDAMDHVARRDEHVRRSDYANALGCWLSLPDCPEITVCENSGADLGQLRDAASHRAGKVEFIQYVAPEEEVPLGKGYGEMGILMEAFDRSERLRESTHVIKVTGRLFLRNLGSWVQQLSSTPSLETVCNLVDHLKCSDSRVFAGTPDFYRDYLFPRREEIDERKGRAFEHALSHAVLRAIADGKAWALPTELPWFAGISGSCNEVPKAQASVVRRIIAEKRFELKRKMFRSWKL